MTIQFRPGRLPNNPAQPRLKLRQFLTAATYQPPASADWDRKVSAWGVLGNDRFGDCVLAAQSHGMQTWTANAGTELVPTEADTLAAYSEVTGFDPNAGPPGQNPTDRGAVMQDALSRWRKIGMPVTTPTGIARHRIYAFAEVDHSSLVEMEAATALFGEAFLGLDFPTAAMLAFDAGEPWDVWEDDGGIEGGHAVCSARYDATSSTPWTVITWGREQPVTTRFLSKYLREAWCVVSPEWVSANGTTPSGLDLAGLGREFTRLTGEQAPWAGNTPPGPLPHSGGLDAAVRALTASPDVRGWLAAPHSGKTRRVARLVQAVIDAANAA